MEKIRMLSLKEEYEETLKNEKENLHKEHLTRHEPYPEEERSIEDLKKDIYGYVIGRENVSFVELKNNIRGFEGDHVLVWPQDNTYLWTNMSPNSIDAITQLIFTERKLTLVPSSQLIYLTDGGALDLPIVTEDALQGKATEKEYWVPMVISTSYSLYKKGVLEDYITIDNIYDLEGL